MLIDTAEIERIGGRAKNPDIDAALRILETNGLILGDQTICPACGQPWTGEPCGQKDNGWPFPFATPPAITNLSRKTPAMQQREPFAALCIGLFSLASWQDGAIWTSGCCAGVAAMLFIEFLFNRAAAYERRNLSR